MKVLDDIENDFPTFEEAANDFLRMNEIISGKNIYTSNGVIMDLDERGLVALSGVVLNQPYRKSQGFRKDDVYKSYFYTLFGRIDEKEVDLTCLVTDPRDGSPPILTRHDDNPRYWFITNPKEVA